MKYYAVLLDGINLNTNLIDSTNNITIDFRQQNNNIIVEPINKDDVIVVCFYDNLIKSNKIFKIISKTNSKITCSKILETDFQASINTRISKEIKENQITEISPDEYKEITFQMISNFVKGDNVTNKEQMPGKNVIYYGVPGCGKSYKIEHEILPQSSEDRENIFRTTFYLDYSNSDFIGQIYPLINDDGIVNYKHVPGPFTKALERALRFKDKTVYLIIEEINRGNAAAIFGDLFQLLDRLNSDYDGRIAGDSEYPITNEFIESYFESRNKELDDSKIEFTKGKLYIPHNMLILATMNTSDQNVFPLDTAFKRRWNRERVQSVWSADKNKIKSYKIPGTDYSWEKFAKGINKIISKYAINNSISEDKCLGSYFANETMLICGNENDDEIRKRKLLSFVSNVIDYLYNDVTKFDHNILFKDDIDNFEDMYNNIYEKAPAFDISKYFKEEVINAIKDAIEE